MGVGVQVTDRDRVLLDWLDAVRLADVDSCAVMLGAVEGREPVGQRVAQQWVERMRRAGLVASERPRYRAGQIVWATRAASGRSEPNPYAGTVPHSLEVARQTAALRRKGVIARADSARPRSGVPIADAVLTWPNGASQLLEVELSTKTRARLEEKLPAIASRWAAEGHAGTLYLARPYPAAAVRAAAQRVLSADNQQRLQVVELPDSRPAAA